MSAKIRAAWSLVNQSQAGRDALRTTLLWHRVDEAGFDVVMDHSCPKRSRVFAAQISHRPQRLDAA